MSLLDGLEEEIKTLEKDNKENKVLKEEPK